MFYRKICANNILPFEIFARGLGSRGMFVVKRSASFFDRCTFRCDLLVVLRGSGASALLVPWVSAMANL